MGVICIILLVKFGVACRQKLIINDGCIMSSNRPVFNTFGCVLIGTTGSWRRELVVWGSTSHLLWELSTEAIVVGRDTFQCLPSQRIKYQMRFPV